MNLIDENFEEKKIKEDKNKKIAKKRLNQISSK